MQSIVDRISVSAIAGLVATAGWLPGSAAGSDAFTNCWDCPVGAHERGRMARFLRAFDIVFEGTCVGVDTVRSTYERGRPLVRFRLRRLLRGISTGGELELVAHDWSDVPATGTPVLAWILRGCTIDSHPCGNYFRLTPERTMFRYLVDSDWRRESALLSCDSLERDILQMPDSTGLDAFDHVTAVALAQLEVQDAINPPRTVNGERCWANGREGPASTSATPGSAEMKTEGRSGHGLASSVLEIR